MKIENALAFKDINQLHQFIFWLFLKKHIEKLVDVREEEVI